MSNFQLDDDEVRFVLDQHTWLDFYSAISPKQQSTDRHVTQLLEDPTVTTKCKTKIKALFLYFNLCLSVKLDSLSRTALV
jgi:hypothetical protein